MAGRSGVRGRALRFVVGLTVAVALIDVLFGITEGIPVVARLIGFSDPSSVPIVGVSGDLLRLVGARGEEVDFFIVHKAHDCKWAAPDGIRLDLGDAAGSRETIEVVEPKQKDWGESVAEGLCDIEIGASFTVPDVPGPEMRTVTGSLVGEFIYPGSKGEGTFSDVRVEMDVPVTLELATEAEAEKLASARRGTELGKLLLTGLALVSGAAYVVALILSRDEKRKPRRWEPALLVLTGAAVWSLLAAAIVSGLRTS